MSTLKCLQDKYDYLFKFIIIGFLARNSCFRDVLESSLQQKAGEIGGKLKFVSKTTIVMIFKWKDFRDLCLTQSQIIFVPCSFEIQGTLYFHSFPKCEWNKDYSKTAAHQEKHGFNTWDTEIPHISSNLEPKNTTVHVFF